MLKYLLPFITSFLLCVFFICLSLVFFGKKVSKNRSSFRHVRKNIIRWGGLAIIFSFNLSILLNKDLYIPLELWGIMIISLFILAVGIWDDIKELSWKIQFLFQSFIAGLVFLFGVRIHYLVNPFSGQIINLDSGWLMGVSFIIGLVWILLLMNAMNWLDGIDGLSGGVTFIAFLTIFFLSLKAEVNQPPMAIMSIILAGSILGFLVFNFNPGKILAGTAGSMFMGFSLAALAVFSGTKIATTLLVLFLPIVDFLWVIWERWKKGQSIFIPDKNHLHFKLLEMGWSQRKIALSFYVITGLIAMVALNTRAIGKSITLILSAVIMALALLTINRIVSKKNLIKNNSKIGGYNFKNKKPLLFILVFVFIILAFFYINKPADSKKTTIRLGQEFFLAEIADNPEKREKGLSGRKELCEKCAMLFFFDNPDNRNFWMKDMQFDIDVIWVKGNKIVDIRSNVSHSKGEQEKIHSPEMADKIIEVRAGKSENLRLKIGDEVGL